jgi:hypothetical protein
VSRSFFSKNNVVQIHRNLTGWMCILPDTPQQRYCPNPQQVELNFVIDAALGEWHAGLASSGEK